MAIYSILLCLLSSMRHLRVPGAQLKSYVTTNYSSQGEPLSLLHTTELNSKKMSYMRCDSAQETLIVKRNYVSKTLEVGIVGSGVVYKCAGQFTGFDDSTINTENKAHSHPATKTKLNGVDCMKWSDLDGASESDVWRRAVPPNDIIGLMIAFNGRPQMSMFLVQCRAAELSDLHLFDLPMGKLVSTSQKRVDDLVIRFQSKVHP